MKNIKAAGLIATAIIACAFISETRGDDLDVRLAALQRENAALKKQLRIKALEKENATLRKQANVADPVVWRPDYQRPTKKRAEFSNATSTLAYAPRAAPASSSALEPVYIAEVPQWWGIYLGGTFGIGWTRSRVASAERYEFYFPTNIPSVNGQQQNNIGFGRDYGGSFDLFLGANTVFASIFLLGGQLEGTISEVGFDASGTRAYTDFNSNGPTGRTASGDFRPHVHARWMASALTAR